jgi:hypothetical protein
MNLVATLAISLLFTTQCEVVLSVNNNKIQRGDPLMV